MLWQGGIFLDGIYPIMFEGEKAGQARVERQGLYYHISCRCSLGQGFYRILLCCDGNKEQLGVCIPWEGSYGLEKKVPVKRLGQANPTFLAVSLEENTELEFVAIHAGKPFSWIPLIPDAKLIIKNGIAGIMIRKD